MRRSPLLFAVAALAVVAVLWYALVPAATSTADPAAESLPDYAAERAAKDSAWRRGAESPLPDSVKARFRGLTYFAPDPAARVVAQYDLLPNAPALLVPIHNSPAPLPYLRAARLRFRLGGADYVLTALRLPNEPPAAPLFVPFTDASNGRTTYGGGRYLDVPPPPAGQTTVVLDFNRAYAPTCAHVADYQCPVPPPENALPVAINAGERQ